MGNNQLLIPKECQGRVWLIVRHKPHLGKEGTRDKGKGS